MKADGEDSTVADLQSNYVKHPLMYTWMLWYLKNERNKLWSDCLRSVGKVSTIEDFWSLFRIIQEASTLQVGSDYYFFKESIRPEWEDKMNCHGGRWIVTVDRNSHRVDSIWLELLVAMMGEQFGAYSEQICGAAVNIRQRGFKVCLWTRDALNEEANRRIGSVFPANLFLPFINYHFQANYERKIGYPRIDQLRMPRRRWR
ncbi:IF4E domain containing protein [Trichuris trichiura]|uniref:eIF-4F 25 kDa subunit n=1 Tax=Trichuris trichiura TaxID=36087 RepID=A0A077ZDU8_TRITR|nr:IF4E domain containing protein [Trichuris trichiura]